MTGHSERLVARARRGDRAARAALVEEHLGLVRAIACRYRGLGVPVEDLVQDGVVGLLTAIDDYDAGRGASFSTFAFWRTRAAVTHAVTARGQLVRVPRPILERRRLLARARGRLGGSSEPALGELAAAASLSPSQAAEALTPIRVASLDRDLVDVADEEAVQPDERVLELEQRLALRRALRRLARRKRAIVERHFGIDRESEPLTAIAADLQLSPERTRTLKDEALRELAAQLAV